MKSKEKTATQAPGRTRVQTRKEARRSRGGTRRAATVTRRAASGAASQKPQSGQKARAGRVASRGKRERFIASAWGNRLPNNDPTLDKFSRRDGIGLYTRCLHQFANIAGYCQAWVDHILVQERAFKPAKASNPEEQAIADAAAVRVQRAWERVKNRAIVLQKLLMGRFYGFARAEMVGRFDDVLLEWIPELFDVPQESWLFDDEGRDFLVTATNPRGEEVDPEKFVHFQWGSADTKYGKGDLSYVYLALWKMQKLDTMALQRIEDNESTVVVHVPRDFDAPEAKEVEESYAKEFRKVIIVPSKESKVVTETPTQNVTTSGATARSEYEGIRLYERWAQTMLLGAPQTGDKSLGTGKVEETRKAIWDDKTPLGSSALDQTITDGWMKTYVEWNMADLRRDLWPRCASDSVDIAEGLSGIQAQEARNVALDLVANRITTAIAIELWCALGMARPRAQAMADSIVKERGSLTVVDPDETQQPIEEAA